MINCNLDQLEEECNNYRATFNHLERFWTQDPVATFNTFLEDETFKLWKDKKMIFLIL